MAEALDLRRGPYPARQGQEGRQAPRDHAGPARDAGAPERSATAPNIDTADVDDVVLGCVAPVGEQGSDIARVGRPQRRLCRDDGGRPDQPFLRERGSRRSTWRRPRSSAARRMFAIGGGVESMSRVPMGADGGAWPMDPAVAYKTYFMPQGIGADLIATKYGFSSQRRRRLCDGKPAPRRPRVERRGGSAKSVVGVKDVIGEVVLDRDEHMRPGTDMQSLGGLNAAFEGIGETMPGFDAIALQKVPRGRAHPPRPHRREQQRHRRRRGRRPASAMRRDRREIRHQAAREASSAWRRSAASRRSC